MKGDASLYRQHLEQLRDKLIAKYDELGLRASGKYEKGLKGEASSHGAEDVLTMWAPLHALFMEKGRSPGKFPPPAAIEQWIEVKKGLPKVFKERKKQFAYVIARKIAKEGIRVPNEFNAGKVISEIVDGFLAEDVSQILEKLGIFWAAKIQSDIVDILKSI